MRFMALLLMVGTLMVACQKDDAKEWQQFYDFTLDDIKGTYDFSYVSSAFNGLTETSFCHICEDATVSVSTYLGSESSIEFKVNCAKETFNKSFTGRPAINEDDPFLLNMSSPNTSTRMPREIFDSTALPDESTMKRSMRAGYPLRGSSR